MNQPITKQSLIERFEESLTFRLSTLIESKEILRVRFTRQLSDLQVLGCSESQTSLVKNIHKSRMQKTDNEIIETQAELYALKHG